MVLIRIFAVYLKINFTVYSYFTNKLGAIVLVYAVLQEGCEALLHLYKVNILLASTFDTLKYLHI